MYDPIKLITNLSLKLDHAIGLIGHKDENSQNINTDKLLTKEECMEILSCNERTLNTPPTENHNWYCKNKKSPNNTTLNQRILTPDN